MVVDGGEFFLDAGVVGGFGAQAGEDGAAVFVALLGDEVAWAFGEEEGAGEGEADRYEGNGLHETVLHAGWGQVDFGAVVDEEA